MKHRIAAFLVLCMVVSCSDGVVPEWAGDRVVAAAVSDLAGRLSIPETDVIVVSPPVPVLWSDSGMGCPQSGETDTEERTEGFTLLLGYSGQTFVYHQGGEQPPFHCPEPQAPAHEESFGADPVGPSREPATTEGIAVEGSGLAGVVRRASPGQVILLRGGTYEGGFHVPEGVTLKPYNGEKVTINGQISMGSNSTIAGLNLTSTSRWVIRVGASGAIVSNVTIRHNKISGGTIEAVRISDRGRDALIEGNEITGGGNHNVKVIGEDGGRPTATIRGNVISDPVREDDVQIEDAGVVLIEWNTFGAAPEQNVDIKPGELVTIRHNDFAISGAEGPLLVTGSALVENNVFWGGEAIQLGCCHEGDPSWTFRSNIVRDHEIWLRQSTRPVIFEGNTVTGGSLQIGHENDWPRDARITGNTFTGTTFYDRTQPPGSFTCIGNTLFDVSDDWPDCS